DLRHIMATYHHARDMIDIGAYTSGSNPMIDRAVQLMGQINGFLRQAPDDQTPLPAALERLEGILTAPAAPPVTGQLGSAR
ncbi:MAG TPA: hypothetical protein VKZ96_05075, partial [Thermomicrobiales bacterium]|nr:hypothetical protein [Thermomicrobiales bacterium]